MSLLLANESRSSTDGVKVSDAHRSLDGQQRAAGSAVLRTVASDNVLIVNVRILLTFSGTVWTIKVTKPLTYVWHSQILSFYRPTSFV